MVNKININQVIILFLIVDILLIISWIILYKQVGALEQQKELLQNHQFTVETIVVEMESKYQELATPAETISQLPSTYFFQKPGFITVCSVIAFVISIYFG